MGGTHARLGPSNHRWPHCPGSPREEAPYPDIPGAAAIDGTGSHLLLELCLTEGKKPQDYDMAIIGVNHEDNPNGWMVSRDRIERVQMCLDYIERRITELKAQFPGAQVTVEAESTSDPGGMFGRDDWWGTVDVTLTAVTPDSWNPRFIEVIDFKDGQGWVGPKGNTQLYGYLAGKMRPYVASGPQLVRPFNPARVGGCRVTIVQPKTQPPVRYEDVPPATVIEVAEGLARAADATDDPNAPLIPGKHCRWCKHRSNCTAQIDESLEKVKTMSENNPLFQTIATAFGNIEELNNQQLAELADTKDGVLSLYDRIEKEVQKRVDSGQEVPGYAYQPGRGKTVWAVEEEDIVKLLRARKFKKDEIYPAKLITPTQVLNSDKLTDTQKEKLKEYIEYVPGDAKLKKVAYDNAGQSSTDKVQSMFGDQANGNAPSAAPTDSTVPSFM